MCIGGNSSSWWHRHSCPATRGQNEDKLWTDICSTRHSASEVSDRFTAHFHGGLLGPEDQARRFQIDVVSDNSQVEWRLNGARVDSSDLARSSIAARGPCKPSLARIDSFRLRQRVGNFWGICYTGPRNVRFQHGIPSQFQCGTGLLPPPFRL